MTAAPTPGPWSYVRNPENTRWIIDSAPAHAIACTAGHEPDNEANARLIAAAPELLAELIALAEILERDCGCPPCEGSDAPAEHHLGRAKRIVAKALGQ